MTSVGYQSQDQSIKVVVGGTTPKDSLVMMPMSMDLKYRVRPPKKIVTRVIHKQQSDFKRIHTNPVQDTNQSVTRSTVRRNLYRQTSPLVSINHKPTRPKSKESDKEYQLRRQKSNSIHYRPSSSSQKSLTKGNLDIFAELEKNLGTNKHASSSSNFLNNEVSEPSYLNVARIKSSQNLSQEQIYKNMSGLEGKQEEGRNNQK